MLGRDMVTGGSLDDRQDRSLYGLYMVGYLSPGPAIVSLLLSRRINRRKKEKQVSDRSMQRPWFAFKQNNVASMRGRDEVNSQQ